MSNPTRVNVNTLEQALSTDINRVGALAGKAAQDPLIGLTAGVDSSVAPRSVVRRGLDLTVGPSLTVVLQAGEFMRFNGSPATDSSQYSLGVLAANLSIDLNAVAPPNPVNPRIYGIHVQTALLNSDLSIRNILVLPSRTITPTPVFKTISPNLDVQVVAGAAAAFPSFPAIPGGRTALWYVYMPPAAISIFDDHLMDSRVYWQPGTIAVNANERLNGLFPIPNVNQVRFEFGSVNVTGIFAETNTAIQKLMSDLIQLGSPVFAPNKQYDFYAIIKGNGAPIGKTVPDGFVIVGDDAATLSLPQVNGQPTFSLVYGPLSFAPANAVTTAVVNSLTDRAVYLGSLTSEQSAQLYIGNSSPTLDRIGTQFAHAIDTERNGRMPWFNGYAAQARFEWLSTFQCRLRGIANALIGGTPGLGDGCIFDTTANLFPGDAIQAVTPNSFYYCYLRKFRSDQQSPHDSPQRLFVPIISTEKPLYTTGQKPTAEVGFDGNDYLFVGSVWNNFAGQFQEFVRDGNRVIWKDIINTIPSFVVPLSPAPRALIQWNMPKTSRVVITNMNFALFAFATGFVTSELRLYSEVGRVTEFSSFTAVASNNALTSATFPFHNIEIPVSVLGQSEVLTFNDLNVNDRVLQVNQLGYIEDPNALPFIP